MTTSSELTKSTTAGETQTRTTNPRRSNYALSPGRTCVHSTARGLPSSVHSSSGLQSPHSCPRSRRRSALLDSRHGHPTFAPLPELSLCVSCSDQCVISTEHVSSWDLCSWEPPSHVLALDSLHLPPPSPSSVSSSVLEDPLSSCANTGVRPCSPKRLLELPTPSSEVGVTSEVELLRLLWDPLFSLFSRLE